MESQFMTPAVAVPGPAGRPDAGGSQRVCARLLRGGVPGFMVPGTRGSSSAWTWTGTGSS
jgi:dihydrodipicolinate synthase/N-acetylneuraminate lyase